VLPTSLIVVAIVVGWLVVLVPLIVRKRQAIARTADSALAARVVRSAEEDGVREEVAMPEVEAVDDTDEERATDRGVDDEAEHEGPRAEEFPAEDFNATPNSERRLDTAEPDRDRDFVDTADVEQGPPPPAWPDPDDVDEPRRHRPGRGGFDPEAAAIAARAKYALRQRVVVSMLLLAIASAVTAAMVMPMVWWAHGAIDAGLVGYLVYLRRQVRIEEEVRQRRLARMAQARRAQAHAAPPPRQHIEVQQPLRPQVEQHYQRFDVETPRERYVSQEPVISRPAPPRTNIPGTVVVDLDDEDPAFDDLQEPGSHRYRRAAGA
jgi:hypothetical protein